MRRILKYVFWDIINNKILFFYTALLMVFSWTSFSLEDNPAKAALTLLNILLLVVPLFSILFSTIYLYRSGEFIELLSSHPIKRSHIWHSLFTGLSTSLVLVFIFGAGIPLFIFHTLDQAILLLTSGILLTLVFVSLAFMTYIYQKDKARGIGISILLWLYLTLLFDGIVLFIMFQFSAYPIEKMMVSLTALSPVDLTRVRILMEMEISAMMGYSGAVFKNYFGTNLGIAVSLGLIALWIFIPYSLSLRKFKRKDL